MGNIISIIKPGWQLRTPQLLKFVRIFLSQDVIVCLSLQAAMFLEKDMQKNTLWFNSLSMEDVDKVGGKNASLGEMVSNLSNAGVSVPNGFATTSYAFNQFLDYEGLDERIHQLLDELDVEDVEALRKTGATIRQWVLEAPFPADLEQDIPSPFDLQQLLKIYRMPHSRASKKHFLM